MGFVSGFVRVILGLIFGAASALALTPAFAAFHTHGGTASTIVMLIVVLLGGVLGFFAPNIRRTFGRGFLMLGASIFVLPISAFLLSGRAVNDVVSQSATGDQAMAAVGAGAAGFLVTGVAAFVGLILGSVFLLIGLVLSLGGRREVEIRYR